MESFYCDDGDSFDGNWSDDDSFDGDFGVGRIVSRWSADLHIACVDPVRYMLEEERREEMFRQQERTKLFKEELIKTVHLK